MSRCFTWLGLVALLFPQLAAAQILPRFVLGSTGGAGNAGGENYTFVVGEPVTGTESWGGGMHTLGFLQPELPTVLATEARLTLKGDWQREPRLTVALQSDRPVGSYLIWRGPSPTELQPLQEVQSEALFFQWTDRWAAEEADAWYYQVVALLQDGQAVRSSVLRLQRPDRGITWRVYPNPARSQVQVQLNGLPHSTAVQVEAFDALGRLRWQQQVAAENGRSEAQFSVANWPAGVYGLRLRQAGQTWTTQLWVSH